MISVSNNWLIFEYTNLLQNLILENTLSSLSFKNKNLLVLKIVLEQLWSKIFKNKKIKTINETITSFYNCSLDQIKINVNIKFEDLLQVLLLLI